MWHFSWRHHLADNLQIENLTDRKRPMSLSTFEFYTFFLLSRVESNHRWHCCWFDVCFLFCESCVSQKQRMIHNIKHWCSESIDVLMIMPYEFTIFLSKLDLFIGTLCIFFRLFSFLASNFMFYAMRKKPSSLPLTLFSTYLFL